MRTFPWTLAACTLVLTGFQCGGSSGGGGTGWTGGPQLIASGPPDYLESVLLEWSEVAGALRYELQGRVVPHDWEVVDDQIPPDAIGGSLTFDEDAPEAATYVFRVRAFKGASPEPWSNEASIFRGVRPATGLLLDAQLGVPPVSLRWTRGSEQADALRLERALVSSGGARGAFAAPEDLAVDAVSYLDTTCPGWADGTGLVYRLTYWKQGHPSAPVTGETGAARPLVPADLSAQPAGPLAIALRWTPRSVWADRLVVLRGGTGGGADLQVAALPTTATSLVDTVPAPGVYSYRIRTQVSDPYGSWEGNGVAWTDEVFGLTALDPAAPFTASLVALPTGARSMFTRSVTRDSLGRLAAVETVDTVARAYLPEGPGAWSTHDEPGTVYGPAILLDALDHPTMFTTWFEGGVGWWIHAAWPGQGGWDGALLPVHGLGDLAMDAAGTLHAVSCDAGFAILEGSAGTWTSEPYPADTSGGLCRLAVGPGGDPRLAWASWVPAGGGANTPVVRWLRREGGSWVEEIVPGVGSVVTGPLAVFHVLAPTADRTVLLYATWEDQTRIHALVRDGGAWSSSPEEIGVPTPGVEAMPVAAHASGRVLIAWTGYYELGGTVSLRGAGGGWTAFTLFPGAWGVAAGFSPSGKAWVLEGLGSPRWVLYEER